MDPPIQRATWDGDHCPSFGGDCCIEVSFFFAFYDPQCMSRRHTNAFRSLSKHKRGLFIHTVYYGNKSAAGLNLEVPGTYKFFRDEVSIEWSKKTGFGKDILKMWNEREIKNIESQ